MSRRSLSTLLAAVLVLLAFPPDMRAQSERGIRVQRAGQRTDAPKLALVIGNSSYPAAPLRNPINDARDVAQALRDFGFEVIHLENADQRQMKEAIREYGDRLRRGETGLFYYAGHGVQSGGSNYLIPIGATVARETELEYEAVNLGFVMAQLEDAGNPLNIVILDACRNNPFATSFRSANQGLAQVSAPTGTLIAYATAPGSVASDGSGSNGLYTQELLRFMRMPGLPIEEVFKQVRIAVRNATQGAQTPWESSSLVGHFAFHDSSANPPVGADAAPPTIAPPTDSARAQASTSPRTPVTPPPASDAASLPPATLDALRSAVGVCMDAVRRKDEFELERLFAADTDEERRERAGLIRWIRAPGAAAEPSSSSAAPDGDGSRAGREFGMKLSWRHAFGGTRSLDVPFRVEIVHQRGEWLLASCRPTRPVRID